MPKIKTRKTLTKRVKITKNGKIMKRQNNLGHLNRKLDMSKRFRKRANTMQENKGHIRIIKRLLARG